MDPEAYGDPGGSLKHIVAIALGLLLMGAQTALAHHCTTYSTSTNEFPEGQTMIVTADTPLGLFYVVNEVCQLDLCGFAIFIWQESNEIAGLQRADTWHKDTCHDIIDPDTLVNF